MNCLIVYARKDVDSGIDEQQPCIASCRRRKKWIEMRMSRIVKFVRNIVREIDDMLRELLVVTVLQLLYCELEIIMVGLTGPVIQKTIHVDTSENAGNKSVHFFLAKEIWPGVHRWLQTRCMCFLRESRRCRSTHRRQSFLTMNLLVRINSFIIVYRDNERISISAEIYQRHVFINT